MILKDAIATGIDFNDFVLALEKLNEKGTVFAISYDGKLGDKAFGQILPRCLNLERIEIEVGRSSQSTLLGKEETTIESLYLSPSLSRSLTTTQISNFTCIDIDKKPKQLTLWEKHGEFAAVTR
ncbi:hypothetical protein [Calothrix sp. NIES-3974]|uniref:hypothetical protein n=1 Tax=Calothrix sp. NIES-3974 TaxID=2005462 RepID=UPI000B61A72D|nr:hypothetical protein [Calothrix sp. NIES-3974]BAZ06135.1 hypothetical protein NIES3974_27920 [Calothrix sp. NIES-3974]